MYRIFFTLLVSFMTVTGALSAPRDSRRSDKRNDIGGDLLIESIKANSDYIYGEGSGSTEAKADKEALANLMSQISVSVSSSFELNESEITTGDSENNYQQAVNYMVKTYSQGTLPNTRRIMISDDPEYRIIRYIHKLELEKVFNGRRDKVTDMVYSAEKSESRGKIDDALRNYYWALCLLKSLPHQEEVTHTDESGTKRMVSTYILNRINEILGDLSIGVAGRNGDDTDVMVRYKGEPVSSVEYSYFDGNDWSTRHSARDGMGTIELPADSKLDKVKVKFEYEYADQAGIDRELEEVMDILKGISFSKAQVELPMKKGELTLSKDAKKVFDKAVEQAGHTDAVKEAPKERVKACSEKLERVVEAIASRNYKSVADCFTPEGNEMFSRLISYGNARLLGKPSVSYLPMGERVVARSVPMNFTFPGNNRIFVEDVTFTFNQDNLIEAVAFGLGQEAERIVFGNGGDAWSEFAKMTLVNFIENYKTAFALKRYNYIESIFDENASIIVGHVVKRKPGSQEDDGLYSMPGDIVTYTRMTKDQYLRQLAHVFHTQPHINIRFTDSEVVKMGLGGETYGIQLKQDYYSTGYADTGYLFLLVDFNEPDTPTIKVRAWQPEKNPDINSHLPKDHPDYGLIGPGSF